MGGLAPHRQSALGRWRVLEETKARVIEDNTPFKDKVLSLFEEHTEAIRKGKAAKPTEFGKMVKIQDAEHQIVTDDEVFEGRPVEADLLLPSIDTHEDLRDRLPRLVAADASFFSADIQPKPQEKGVEQLSVPNKKNPEQGSLSASTATLVSASAALARGL